MKKAIIIMFALRLAALAVGCSVKVPVAEPTALSTPTPTPIPLTMTGGCYPMHMTRIEWRHTRGYQKRGGCGPPVVMTNATPLVSFIAAK